MELIVVVDKGIESTPIGKSIIKSMSKEFLENGQVKCLTQKNDIPLSIQWMKKVDKDDWQYAEFIFVLFPSSKLYEFLRNHPHVEVHELLLQILGRLPDPSIEKVCIDIFKDKSVPRGGYDVTDVILEQELKKQLQDKAYNLSAESLMLHQTILNVKEISKDEACNKMINAAKSLLEPPRDLGSWNPKSKKAFVLVEDKVGLKELWQRYLMQMAQTIKDEKVRVICENPEFSSLSRTVNSYSNRFEGGESIVKILDKKGNKIPGVGVETSRKISKVLFANDPDMLI